MKDFSVTFQYIMGGYSGDRDIIVRKSAPTVTNATIQNYDIIKETGDYFWEWTRDKGSTIEVSGNSDSSGDDASGYTYTFSTGSGGSFSYVTNADKKQTWTSNSNSFYYQPGYYENSYGPGSHGGIYRKVYDVDEKKYTYSYLTNETIYTGFHSGYFSWGDVSSGQYTDKAQYMTFTAGTSGSGTVTYKKERPTAKKLVQGTITENLETIKWAYLGYNKPSATTETKSFLVKK